MLQVCSRDLAAEDCACIAQEGLDGKPKLYYQHFAQQSELELIVAGPSARSL